jgi:hypothetical protein
VGCGFFVSALRSSGSKLPRHGFFTLVPFVSCRGFFLATGLVLGAASQPSGDKSPRHESGMGASIMGQATFLQAKKKTLNFKVFL